MGSILVDVASAIQFVQRRWHWRWLVATANAILMCSAAASANCMSTDPYYWQGGRRLPIYDPLMSLMACQGSATLWEGQELNDTSACNWFLTRALERAYGVKDFVPAGDDDWLSANRIYDYVSTNSSWSKLGNAADQKTLEEAARGAQNGQPVIAVRRGSPHGHVALILPGPLKASSSWHMNVPNSASFFLDSKKKVEKAYVGCALSYAFSGKDGIEIYWRLKAE